MEKNQMMDMHVEKGLDSEYVIDSSSLDPLFEEAARIIVTMRSGFASLIQRRLSTVRSELWTSWKRPESWAWHREASREK